MAMMAIPKDWCIEAAREIAKNVGKYPDGNDPQKIAEIIAQHCPFEQGVMYEPVRERSDRNA